MFSEYGPRVVGQEDLDRLSMCFDDLHRARVRFALSYCYSRERRAMFARWRIREIRIRRNIAGFASAIRGAYELIACTFLENGELIP